MGPYFRTSMPGLFFQHFSLNSRRNKLKDLAKLKDFSLNSSIFLPKLKISPIFRYEFSVSFLNIKYWVKIVHFGELRFTGEVQYMEISINLMKFSLNSRFFLLNSRNFC